jgi:hypothetical protein
MGFGGRGWKDFLVRRAPNSFGDALGNAGWKCSKTLRRRYVKLGSSSAFNYGKAAGPGTGQCARPIHCQMDISDVVAEKIWRSHAPLKCKSFMWLAAQHRLWTSDPRLRHVLQDQRACYAGRRYNRAHTAALLVCKV